MKHKLPLAALVVTCITFAAGCACGPCGDREEAIETAAPKERATPPAKAPGLSIWTNEDLKKRAAATGWTPGQCTPASTGAADGVSCALSRHGFEARVTLARHPDAKSARSATAELERAGAIKRDGAALVWVEVSHGDAARRLRDSIMGGSPDEVDLSAKSIRDIEMGIHASGWKAGGSCKKAVEMPVVEWTCSLERDGAEATVLFSTVNGAPHEVNKGIDSGHKASADQGDAALKVETSLENVARKIMDALESP